MSAEPLWTTRPINGPRSSWPKGVGEGYRPLSGIEVVDFSRVAGAPATSKTLALLGADVLKITSSKLADVSPTWIDPNTRKDDTDIDLKSEEGKKIFAELVRGADVLINGHAHGALKSLGFDTSSLHKINPSLVYVRENCYGFVGPFARRSGWQEISDCLVGVSCLQGRFMGLDEPVVPLLRR